MWETEKRYDCIVYIEISFGSSIEILQIYLPIYVNEFTNLDVKYNIRSLGPKWGVLFDDYTCFATELIIAQVSK